MRNTFELQEQGLLWVNITSQTEKELEPLYKRYGFAKKDVEECLPHFQRPKIVKRDNYYFMVLQFPIFNRKTRRLGFTEIDFFLTQNLLVTIHDQTLIALDDFFTECVKDVNKRRGYFQGTMVHVLFEMLNRIFESIFPILLHVNEDITAIDHRLLSETPSREMAEEILRLKTNMVSFRRTMQSHKTVLERLVMNADKDIDMVSYQNYITGLREDISEIWHMLESQKESIDALHETSESILSLHTNDVMKTLTIISVITFPLTLVATLFAIHSPGTPLVDLPGGFWILLCFMGLGALLMVMVFKNKKWM